MNATTTAEASAAARLLAAGAVAIIDITVELVLADDAARCADCGHLPGLCECPHDCTPTGAQA